MGTDKKLPRWALVVVLVIIVLFAFIIIPSLLNTEGGSSTPPPAPAITQQDSIAAQKELTDFMALSEKANLVTSYELSATQDTIFVGAVWYTQTVQFKKDFLGKVATLKEEAFGSHFFEVHDAYSNEKVAEVTAFSGSLEIYK